MSDTQATVSLPSASSALSDALANLALAIVANHKSSGGALVEASADVTAAIGALSPVLASAAGLGAEASSEPIGVAEAFALAGFKVARSLTGK